MLIKYHLDTNGLAGLCIQYRNDTAVPSRGIHSIVLSAVGDSVEQHESIIENRTLDQ